MCRHPPSASTITRVPARRRDPAEEEEDEKGRTQDQQTDTNTGTRSRRPG